MWMEEGARQMSSIAGTFPMLYAFFDDAGALQRDAFAHQVAVARACNADGVAVLGLGTEVAKLARDERRQILDWTLEAAGTDLPVAATLAEGNVPDMKAAARAAERAGAAWLVLQPPAPPASGSDLIAYFAAIADAVSCPVAIQNAPEFLGIGLTIDELIALHERQPNVVAVKAESSALALGRLVDALDGRMTALNGRAGLELTDNYRAGAAGMIPGIETIDLQVAIGQAMREGRHEEAEAMYRNVLPALTFIMQGIAHFVAYGKRLAAARMGIAPGGVRLPSAPIEARGLAWVGRLAAQLGPLPTTEDQK